MIDLTDAIRCIQTMKANGTYRGEQIGIVRKDISSGAYVQNQIVIYSREMHPPVSSLGINQDISKTLTIELPMSPKELERQKKNKSLLTTMCTMINVPESYVEEIRM